MGLMHLFSKSYEFERKSIDDIKEYSTKIFNNACNQANINDESKPRFEIELNDKLLIIKDGKEAVIKKPSNYESISGQGQYNSESHTVKINANNCMTSKEFEETIAHELYHAKEAIIRNGLSQEERNNVVKDVLVENILNGDNDKIIYSINGSNYKIFRTPITKPKDRQHIVDFANNHLFTDNKKSSKKLERYYQLNYETPQHKRTTAEKIELKHLKNELKDYIKDFDTLCENVTVKNKLKKDGEKDLFKYLISIENRYHYFKKQEQTKTNYIPTEEEKANIKESIASNIEAVEGNYAFEAYLKEAEKENSFIKKLFSKKDNMYMSDFNNYKQSKEEFLARQHGKDLLIEEIEQKEKLTLRDKLAIKKLKNAKKLEEAQFNLYNTNKKYRKNPNFENWFNFFKATMKMSAYFNKTLIMGSIAITSPEMRLNSYIG